MSIICDHMDRSVGSTSRPVETALKIKKEEIDPEIEEKLKEISVKVKAEPQEEFYKNFGQSDRVEDERSSGEDSDTSGSNDDQDLLDDKKLIEPVKSSNELLMELFKVFNAAPPEELLNDENLLRKSHKMKKHKKGKKKKNRRIKSEPEDLFDRNVNDNLEMRKYKKKKKQKHKDKDKSKGKDKRKHTDAEKVKIEDGESDGIDREPPKLTITIRNKTVEVSRKHRIDQSPDYEVSRKIHRKSVEREKNSRSNGHIEHRAESAQDKNSFRSSTVKLEESPQEKESDERHPKVELGLSDISLSDEETSNERSIGNQEPRRNHSRTYNNFYAGAERYYSRSRDRHRGRPGSLWPYSTQTRSRLRRRSRSRTRSPSRPRDLGIDKKRLLEIARKNAISMFKRGSMPGVSDMSEEVKDKVLLKMRYGGRTVEDLTEFCKKISKGENLSDLSSGEDSDVDKSGNIKAFHHPFVVKDREPIVLQIRNAMPITPRKTDELKAITMQFPVSSGQHHRMSEVWRPVETKDTKGMPLVPLPPATQSTDVFKKSAISNVFGKPLPEVEQQKPAFRPLKGAATDLNETPTCNGEEGPQTQTPDPGVPRPEGIATTLGSLPAPESVTVPVPDPVPTPFFPDVPIPSTTTNQNSIFPESPTRQFDVSNIITKRLNALRRLQENPMDPEAIKMMYNAQKEMSSWANSKHLPGQFTGSTGANVLKVHELNSGPQAWVRKDQLMNTQPMTGGMGMQLLQKMGWKPGEGLGRQRNGTLQPLLLDIKLDKRGLDVTSKSEPVKRPTTKRQQQVEENLQNKHPVCLLNELSSKRKWTPPMYTCIDETGMPHSRMFVFSVNVNGQTYTPDKGANTKKEAKLMAAKCCLQKIGLLPP